jgi:hypothetical protein
MIDHVYFYDFPGFLQRLQTEGKLIYFPFLLRRIMKGKMLSASFNYVACLPVGRYWLWGKAPMRWENIKPIYQIGMITAYRIKIQ